MRFSLPILALATSAYAQLTITEPSTNHWWVANSINTIKWTGTQPTTFNVFLVNSDSTVLNDKLALISVQPVYEYSKSFTPGSNAKAATGYTIQFTDTLNSSNVYATSQTFEIKAQGSTYPPQGSGDATANPSGSAGASGTNSASPSGTSGASARPSNAAFGGKEVHAGVGAVLGGVLAVVGLL